jgi:hypothetical protein
LSAISKIAPTSDSKKRPGFPDFREVTAFFRRRPTEKSLFIARPTLSTPLSAHALLQPAFAMKI